MEDIVRSELDALRAENKILRDSLTEIRPAEPDSAKDALKNVLREFMGALGASVESAKAKVEPVREIAESGKEKMTGFLSRQIEKNPAPVLLAALGAGFLFARRLRRKRRAFRWR